MATKEQPQNYTANVNRIPILWQQKLPNMIKYGGKLYKRTAEGHGMPQISVSMEIRSPHSGIVGNGTFSANLNTLMRTQKMSKQELVEILATEFSSIGGGGELPYEAVKKVYERYPRAVLEILWSGTFGGA
jgi:hypothetical protein